MSALLLSDIQPFSRRGVCPALSAPMQTGDGLLSRVAFVAALAPQDITRLCSLASLHGNGMIDITARGGLQFRGLMAESACALESDVLALELPLREGLAVETSPLGALDAFALADPEPIASRIRQHALTASLHEKLAAKMSVVIDGGGQLSMGELLADIRLKVVRCDGAVFWQLMLGGSESDALKAGVVLPEHAADTVIALLNYLAEQGPLSRGRNLDPDVVRAVCGVHLQERVIDRQEDASRSPYGLIPLANGRWAVGVAPAFGQLEADELAKICVLAETLGFGTVKPALAHSLLLFGGKAQCETLLVAAKEQGFIVSDHDPRSSIAVCPGMPACASAYIATHDLAAFAATECASLLDGSFRLHVSGCAKGCAHPTPSLLSVFGSPQGVGVSISRRVSDVPDMVLPFEGQRGALKRLAQFYEKEHKPGENVRAFFSRLGTETVSAVLQQDD